MRILMVSIAAPPKTGGESLQVARVLRELCKNNDITLLTETTNYDSWITQNKSYTETFDLQQRIELPVTDTSMLSRIKRKIFASDDRLPDNKWQFIEKVNSLNFEYEYDLIYSRSLPLSSAVAALNLKKRLKTPWIMHLSDPWTPNPYHPHQTNYHLQMEKACIEHADIITLTNRKVLELYQSLYPDHSEKFKLFPNVYDDNQLNTDSLVLTKDYFEIVHAGNLYGNRNPEIFVESLKLLPEKIKGRLKCVFVGNMSKPSLEILKSVDDVSIELTGGVSYEASLEYMKKADLLLAIEGNFEPPVEPLFFPSKLLDYMCMNKATLVLTDKGSPSDLFIHNRYGLAVNGKNSREVADAIQSFYEAFSKGNQHGSLMQEADENFSAKKNVILLQSWMEELLTAQ